MEGGRHLVPRLAPCYPLRGYLPADHSPPRPLRLRGELPAGRPFTVRDGLPCRNGGAAVIRPASGSPRGEITGFLTRKREESESAKRLRDEISSAVTGAPYPVSSNSSRWSFAHATWSGCSSNAS
jgi:hypothetical protein